jgi:hypothetical protein
MVALAYILSGLSLLTSVLFLIRSLRPPLGFLAAFLKLIAASLSPYWAIVGAAGAIIGWISEAYWAIPMGIVGAGWMIGYVWRCTRDHNGFENAFGAGWSDQIQPEQTRRMVQGRWSFLLPIKAERGC